MKVFELINENNDLEEVTDVSSFLVPDQSPGDITHNIFKLMDMLDAAKRGLGLANKLRNPEDKKKNLRMVMINLNKIRHALAKVEKMF